jgi:SAM-dependent methyltransferase
MLERARTNVRKAGLEDKVAVESGDILSLQQPDNSFDRVVAEAVTMFVDRPRAASELVRVCRPGGMVLATEFLWRKPPSERARELFLGQLCPGMQFDNLDGWVQIYSRAGLADIQVRSGPFEMMTPRGFLQDEGLLNTLAVMGRGMTRPSYLRKMTWMMPRLAEAVPYLGYVVVAGTKPGR